MFFNNFFVDVFLINKMQSFVTWCECKADISRADLGYLLLALSYIPLITIGILTFGGIVILLAMPDQVSVETLSNIVIFLALIYMVLNSGKLLRKNLEDSFKKTSQTLPKEIQKRSVQRLTFLIVTSIFFLLILISTLDFPKDSSLTLQLFLTISSIFISPFLFSTTAEYFMCTVSLPPKEKESRRLKKEASNMVSQKT